MFTYMTPSDAGRGDEGTDRETEGLADLFDTPGDEEKTTFDMEPGRPFAFDGLGQLIAEEQLEQLTVPEAKRLAPPSVVERSGLGGLGATATTLTDSAAYLPEPPAGEKWKLVGPTPDGEGFNWETVPVEPSPEDEGFIEMIKRNKVVAGATALATLGALWWLFLRKKGAE